ncbi:hypothetical protein GQ600_16875 [Phytophthora cactorum]|nr:hypothetical protein GQ600_16875 [Phytophthora cactorum]
MQPRRLAYSRYATFHKATALLKETAALVPKSEQNCRERGLQQSIFAFPHYPIILHLAGLVTTQAISNRLQVTINGYSLNSDNVTACVGSWTGASTRSAWQVRYLLSGCARKCARSPSATYSETMHKSGKVRHEGPRSGQCSGGPGMQPCESPS